MVKKNIKQASNIRTVIMILVVLFLISLFFSSVISLFVEKKSFGNVVLIPIRGAIVSDGIDIFSLTTTSSTKVVEKIERAEEDPGVKAVIFEINSPGGSAVASEEIVRAIEQLNKTTAAWIREIGASGAYWIAAVTDHIVASRMSMLGSVGVISSYPQLSEFLEKHNITYNRLVAGKYKDIANPFTTLTDEERALLQAKIDSIHSYFLDEVAKNRNLAEAEKEEVSTGIFYIGLEAIDLNLVDELGSKEEAIKYLEQKLNITVTLKKYEEKRTLIDILTEVMSEQSYYLGRGIANFLNIKDNYIRT